jgi:bifunctional non-homologous end joining protein LigD
VPIRVVEVKYGAWIEGKLRFPVFLRRRPDLDETEGVPRDSVQTTDALEVLAAAKKPDALLTVEGHRFGVTNLPKVLWPAEQGKPEVKKGDLIRYYAAVADVMVPHLQDRPLSIVRFPNGIQQGSFFQKHWEKGFPDFVRKVPIWSGHNKRPVEYLLCNDAATLVWLGQMAAIEIHPWYSRATNAPDEPGHGTDFASGEAGLDASALEYPDFMVFDLDPYTSDAPDLAEIEAAWHKAAAVGLRLKEVLDMLGLRGYPKTSGKSGLHVYLPLQRVYTYDQVRAFAETLGRHLMAQIPDLVTMEWVVSKRPKKVFFDHNQNVRGKTLIGAYAPRPVAGAPVSFPLRWEEVGEVTPSMFTLFSVPDLLETRGDVWAAILSDRQRLAV